MSRFSELKAAGTGTRFSNSPIRVKEGKLAGANRRRLPRGSTENDAADYCSYGGCRIDTW